MSSNLQIKGTIETSKMNDNNVSFIQIDKVILSLQRNFIYLPPRAPELVILWWF
jgi:hypothetical protein